MAESEEKARNVDLTLLIQGNTFWGAFGSRVPRLVVVVRGSTTRADQALTEERRAECRFGAVGVMVGPAPPQPGSPGDLPMKWRDLGLDELKELLRVVDALRGGDVDGVVDTGDYYHSVFLSGFVDDELFGITASQMQSGWRGADAASFVELIRCLFGIAGISLEEPRWHGLAIVRE
jgi:hypothetical protein